MLAAFSAVFLCIIVFQYHRSRQYSIDLIDNQLQLYNRQAGEALADGERIEDFVAAWRAVFGNVRLTLIERSGRVLYDSEQEASKMPNHAHRHEVLHALKKGSGYTIRRQSTATGNTYFYSATLVDTLVIRLARRLSAATSR